MKKKMRFRQFLSGIMAVMTILTTTLSPLGVYAAEPEKKEVEYPTYEEVKDQLAADEVVTAKDYELKVGVSFDVEKDFSGLEIPDEKKVKVTLHEAKNEAGESFSTDHTDTYKTVYYVEPLSGNPIYQIHRNLVIKAPKTQTEPSTQQGNLSGDGQGTATEETSDEEGESDSELPVSEEIVTEPSVTQPTETEMPETGEMETQNPEQTETEVSETNTIEAEQPAEESETSEQEEKLPENAAGEVTDLTVDEALQEAEKQGVDIENMEVGESVSFYAMANSRAIQLVTVTKGTGYSYADYGMGSYITYRYTVKFGDVSATAYCIQPSAPSPGSGTYTITRLKDGKALAKVCYYGTKASGENGYFAEKHPNFSEGKKFIIEWQERLLLPAH